MSESLNSAQVLEEIFGKVPEQGILAFQARKQEGGQFHGPARTTPEERAKLTYHSYASIPSNCNMVEQPLSVIDTEFDWNGDKKTELSQKQKEVGVCVEKFKEFLKFHNIKFIQCDHGGISPHFIIPIEKPLDFGKKEVETLRKLFYESINSEFGLNSSTNVIVDSSLAEKEAIPLPNRKHFKSQYNDAVHAIIDSNLSGNALKVSETQYSRVKELCKEQLFETPVIVPAILNLDKLKVFMQKYYAPPNRNRIAAAVARVMRKKGLTLSEASSAFSASVPAEHSDTIKTELSTLRNAYKQSDNKLGVLHFLEEAVGKEKGRATYAELHKCFLSPEEKAKKEDSNKEKTVDKTINKLQVLTPYQIKKYKHDKSYIIKGLIARGQSYLIFGESGTGKSLFTLAQIIAISKGIDFMGLPTKPVNCLYCDHENGLSIIQDRLSAIGKGLGIKRLSENIYFYQDGNFEDNIFLDLLFKFVVENNIKLVVFDTLRRFLSNIDENDSTGFNFIFTKVIRRLTSEFDCTVIYLHHTLKGDKSKYRGSGDIEALCDASYCFNRADRNKEFFSLDRNKDRSGLHLERLSGRIEATVAKDVVKFIRMETQLTSDDFSKKIELQQKICEMMSVEKAFSISDTRKVFSAAQVDFTEPTLKRALEWLCDATFLRKEGIGKSTKYHILRKFQVKEEQKDE